MSDHGELADQREAEAAELEHHAELVGESADTARKALKDLQDDPALAAPLEDEDEAAENEADEEA